MFSNFFFLFFALICLSWQPFEFALPTRDGAAEELSLTHESRSPLASRLWALGYYRPMGNQHRKIGN